jgi:putative ABC transport system permease protein
MLSRLKTALRALLRKRLAERELDEELRYHIEQQTEQNIRLGMNPEEARIAALKAFGGMEQAKERSRDARGLRWLEDIWQDLRFGLRMLLKRKEFTAVALLTLALGIGANTAIFSVVNAILLRPLPFVDAGRLVMIWETHPDIPRAPVSIPDFQDWQAQSQSFEEMAVYADRLGNAVLVGLGKQTTVQGSCISQNLFPMLGLKPILGRNFLPEEERRENNRVVILSHALWRQSFAGDPGVIGKTIQLNNDSFTVVGVMGEQYPLDMDVWLPLTHIAADDFVDRDHHPLAVVGRLKSGVTLERARRDMNAIASRLQLEYPGSNKNIGVELLPLRQQLVGNLQSAVLLAFAAVGLILLIACSNVSNLFLAQAAGRQKELALRAALGAGRGRLARQLLLEGLLLALLGAVAGLALAKCILPLLRTGLMEMGAAKIPGLESIGIDPSTLVFTFGVTVLTGLLFGILPALQFSSVDLNQMLKDGFNRPAGSGRRKISRLLVAAEVALAVIVLVGAGLLVRSFQRLSSVDPGFHAEQLLSLKIDLPSARYPKSEQINSFYQRLIPRLQTLPGVEGVAIIDRLPFGPSLAIEPFTTDGHFPEPGADPLTQMRSVDHRFFEVMRIPLRRGRFFDETEIEDNPRNHVLINETMERRFFPNQDPVGRQIFMRAPPNKAFPFTIIGVVADIKDLGLDAPVEPEIYFPGRGSNAVLLLGATVEPSSLTSSVQQTVLSIDPALPLQTARSMEELLSNSFARRRLTTALLSVFASLALILAAIGIYGVVSYSVIQRTQEIGIRMTLGAQARDVFKLIIGHGIGPVLLGLAVGMAGAVGLSRWMTSLMAGLLFEVHPGDPVTLAAIAVLLAIIALLACWIPARRATKVDPLLTLRSE